MLLFGRKENKAFGLFGLSGHVVLMCVLGEGVVRFLDSSLGHMSSVVAFLVPSWPVCPVLLMHLVVTGKVAEPFFRQQEGTGRANERQ